MKLNKEILKAINAFSDENNVRFFLNGIYVNFDKKEIAATEGHVLAVLRDVELEGEGEVIIPHTTVLKALKILKKGQVVEIKQNQDNPDTGTIGEVGWTSIEGKFPNYQYVLDGKNNRRGQMPVIQSKFLERAENLMNALGGDFVWVPSRYPLATLFMTSEDKTEKNQPRCEIAVMPIKVPFKAKQYDADELDKLDRWMKYEKKIEEMIHNLETTEKA